MAYSLGVHHSEGSTTGNGFTTSAIDTTGSDFLIVHLGTVTNSGTLSDSKGNTWTSLTQHNGNGSRFSQFFYCQSPTVGTGHTFSITGTSNFPSLNIAAFTGSTTTPFDAENGAGSVFTNTQQPGNVTPSVGNELIIAALIYDGADLPTINQSFIVIDTVNDNAFGHQSTQLAYIVETAATAKNPTFSWTNSSTAAASIATFKASGGGGGPVITFGNLPMMGCC